MKSATHYTDSCRDYIKKIGLDTSVSRQNTSAVAYSTTVGLAFHNARLQPIIETVVIATARHGRA